MKERILVIDNEEHIRRLRWTPPWSAAAWRRYGLRHDVLVQIELETVEYVERMTGRHLAADSSFWTAQARRLLADFLWNERGVPPMRRLVLKSLDPDKLPVAARWKAEGVKR